MTVEIVERLDDDRHTYGWKYVGKTLLEERQFGGYIVLYGEDADHGKTTTETDTIPAAKAA